LILLQGKNFLIIYIFNILIAKHTLGRFYGIYPFAQVSFPLDGIDVNLKYLDQDLLSGFCLKLSDEQNWKV
jgi:hypothetical protein